MATRPFNERLKRYTQDPDSVAAGVFRAVTAHLEAEDDPPLSASSPAHFTDVELPGDDAGPPSEATLRFLEHTIGNDPRWPE